MLREIVEAQADGWYIGPVGVKMVKKAVAAHNKKNPKKKVSTDAISKLANKVGVQQALSDLSDADADFYNKVISSF